MVLVVLAIVIPMAAPMVFQVPQVLGRCYWSSRNHVIVTSLGVLGSQDHQGHMRALVECTMYSSMSLSGDIIYEVPTVWRPIAMSKLYISLLIPAPWPWEPQPAEPLYCSSCTDHSWVWKCVGIKFYKCVSSHDHLRYYYYFLLPYKVTDIYVVLQLHFLECVLSVKLMESVE